MPEPTDRTGPARQLWEAYALSRDPQTRGELIEHYMPVAKIIAAKVFGLRTDVTASFDDYLQYARVGLVEAVDRFDWTRSVPFEAYSAPRIRGAILNGIAHETEFSAQRSFWRVRMQDRTDSLLGDKSQQPERATLQELIQVTVGLALGLVLDESAEEPVDEQLQSNPYAMTEMEQLIRQVRALLVKLPEREQQIIREHYFERRELQAIATEYGLTKGRVSQIHAQAIGRLRSLLGEKIDTKL
ncbi:sigma-70 family RNA polymerase sigma factor [Steroidobacter flavus]|uniref:Sigma-70 family RNA polymerase sigma factor n=1 Tax=Steroidobacter flavus TaxID=1842136 RepID=A0ABV8SYM3_9GAMM